MLAYLFQLILNGLVLGSLFALVATGLTLVLGVCDVLNLAHGSIFMLGAIISYFLVSVFNINFFLSMPLSMCILFFVNMFLEQLFRPCYDKPLLNILLLSIGLMIVIDNITMAIVGPETRYIPFPIEKTLILDFLNVIITYQRLFIILITILIIAILNILIKKTKFGKALRATAQNRDAAQLMGIDVQNMFSLSFAISGSLAALAGALLGSLFGADPTMGLVFLIKAFAIVVFGGLGSVVGAIYGGVILGMAEVFGSTFISSAYKDSIAFILIIVILLFRPKGLFKESVS